MRRTAPLLVVALAIVLSGCSSDAPLGVELSHPDRPGGTLTFTATGPAVDEGALCPTGAQRMVQLRTTSGEEITEAEWAATFDAALEEGGVAELITETRWTCEDGSGTFDMDQFGTFDLATFEFEGRQDVGTWTITGGTDAHEGLSGSGDTLVDFDAGTVEYSGEVSR